MDLPPDDPTEPVNEAQQLRAKGAVESPLRHSVARVFELYSELLNAVARKFEGESRHETALRYIRECEAVQGGTADEVAGKPILHSWDVAEPVRNVGSGGEAPGSLIDG